ncbi:MAG TPA: hypothetical protein PKE45_00010 [Caldilineaceae bacterium]|nr:hypothetical protein [Caldilineaceae bacterium]
MAESVVTAEPVVKEGAMTLRWAVANGLSHEKLVEAEKPFSMQVLVMLAAAIIGKCSINHVRWSFSEKGAMSA